MIAARLFEKIKQNCEPMCNKNVLQHPCTSNDIHSLLLFLIIAPHKYLYIRLALLLKRNFFIGSIWYLNWSGA